MSPVEKILIGVGALVFVYIGWPMVYNALHLGGYKNPENVPPDETRNLPE